MLELLWLLLPVAAASGWYVARRGRSNEGPGPRSAAGVGAEYFKGLNYLLNEQPDKALEVFVRMVEVDSSTVETHFALGNLFRRRGEVDRAIRIHQNLIARPTLTGEHRAQALFELGEDYMRAGLFDRAESLFDELVRQNANTERALQRLREIYQREKEWEEAIRVARRLETQTGRAMAGVIAHYHCEQAEEARRRGGRGEALRLIKHALLADRGCARASLLQGDIEMAAGHHKAAVRAYRQVEDQDIDYLPEVLEPLHQAYVQMGKPGAMLEYLYGVLPKYDGVAPALALAELLRQQQGEESAAEFLAQQLRSRPSIRGLDRLIAFNVATTEGPARERLEVLAEISAQLLADLPRYRCERCGFAGKVMHWQCPSCKCWSTIKPVKRLELEEPPQGTGLPS
ncbi:MAG: lipopolysaccharide assembly protein LapB [Gammaproteobacteria bacterium]|nr:lipopolysaccharide assembly protein LapB [Gammaproteobacteria bacterium]